MPLRKGYPAPASKGRRAWTSCRRRPRGTGRQAQSGGPKAGCSSFLSPCLALRWFRFFHFLQVTLESVYASGPEPSELIEPVVHLEQGFRLESIESALRVHGGLHETSLPQHPQVFRHTWLRHAKSVLDLSNRAFSGYQQAQDRPAVWLGNDVECGFHGEYIHEGVYTCQGI